MRVNIDERNLNNRAALFAAIANGDKLRCFALPIGGGDANTRDEHGHIALEVAVRGRNLDIVKTLIQSSAAVNTDVTNCSCLPLHAAIESEIIYDLLAHGAEVDCRRIADQKHAINLAIDRWDSELAEAMRGRVPILNPAPFLGS